MSAPGQLDVMVRVDESLCITCGACIRACPGGLIARKDFPVPVEGGWDLCIDCGHCVAICPTGAMRQRSMGPGDCEEIDIHLIPRWDRVRQYLISRRSVRGYIRRAIEREKVLQLLDVARHAPNGANRQVILWVVINDPAKVRRMSEMTIEWMKVVREKNRALYEEARISSSRGNWARIASPGERRASSWPVPPRTSGRPPPAAMIAIHQVQLAAPALDLGTTFVGSLNMACQGYPPLVEMLGLPEGHVPHATCAIGYPAEKYHRIPVRRPLDVMWL